MDILESSANPFRNDVGEGPILPLDPSQNPAVNLSEDHSIRASLIPFRDWLVIFDSNRNTVNTEGPRQPLHISPLETSSSYSTLAFPSPSDINPSPEPLHPSPSLAQGSSRSLARDKSSNNVHSSPSRCSIAPSSTTGLMAASSPPDPFVESSAAEGEGLTQIESEVFAYHREGNSSALSSLPCEFHLVLPILCSQTISPLHGQVG